jgi:hypothetical protein
MKVAPDSKELHNALCKTRGIRGARIVMDAGSKTIWATVSPKWWCSRRRALRNANATIRQWGLGNWGVKDNPLPRDGQWARIKLEIE